MLGSFNFGYNSNAKECFIGGRRIFLEGTNDARAEAKIRGMTLQAAYVDEMTLCSEDFFTTLLGRLSKPKAKLIGTTNPDSPNHWLLKKYINRANELDLKTYHFSLYDNISLEKDYIGNLKKEFQGIFYDRFILGKWVLAEGLVYPEFAENKDDFIFEKPLKSYDALSIGIDYGASKSETAFVLVGFSGNFKEVHILEEFLFGGIRSPDELYAKFESWHEFVKDAYGQVNQVFCDYGALGQILTKGLQLFMASKRMTVKIKDCLKGRIIDRIQLVGELIAKDRFKVNSRCVNLIESLQSAVWDDKHENDRLDDGTVNIDVIDAMEYAIFPYAGKLVRKFEVL
jgi:PBSX family phage terminase large subunit